MYEESYKLLDSNGFAERNGWDLISRKSAFSYIILIFYFWSSNNYFFKKFLWWMKMALQIIKINYGISPIWLFWQQTSCKMDILLPSIYIIRRRVLLPFVHSEKKLSNKNIVVSKDIVFTQTAISLRVPLWKNMFNF